MSSLDVFVLAGGLGTRIRPVLGEMPKLLAPIRGGTYIDGLVDWLQRFGARRVLLGLGHQAQTIVKYLRTHPKDDVTIETIIEPQPLGTAGAIRFARPHLRTDPVLVLNGDSISDTDLCAFLGRHRKQNSLATILCAEVDDAARYGRLLIDDNDMITGFVEKDRSLQGRAIINAGAYLMSAALLDLIAVGDAKSLERDVFARLRAGSLAAYTGCTNFIDIGTPESLDLANRM